jgi:hypothetical protein
MEVPVLKGKGQRNGRETLIFGLSHMNLERLKEDMPIHIHGEEMSIPYDIVIFAGETEEAMAEMVANPDTIIHRIDPKPRN